MEMDIVKTDTGADAIWRTVADYLAAEDLELDDLELRGSGGGRVLRVVVDAEGGVESRSVVGGVEWFVKTPRPAP